MSPRSPLPVSVWNRPVLIRISVRYIFRVGHLPTWFSQHLVNCGNNCSGLGSPFWSENHPLPTHKKFLFCKYIKKNSPHAPFLPLFLPLHLFYPFTFYFPLIPLHFLPFFSHFSPCCWAFFTFLPPATLASIPPTERQGDIFSNMCLLGKRKPYTILWNLESHQSIYFCLEEFQFWRNSHLHC